MITVQVPHQIVQLTCENSFRESTPRYGNARRIRANANCLVLTDDGHWIFDVSDPIDLDHQTQYTWLNPRVIVYRDEKSGKVFAFAKTTGHAIPQAIVPPKSARPLYRDFRIQRTGWSPFEYEANYYGGSKIKSCLLGCLVPDYGSQKATLVIANLDLSPDIYRSKGSVSDPAKTNSFEFPLRLETRWDRLANLAVVSVFRSMNGYLEAVIRERPSFGLGDPSRDCYLSNEQAIRRFTQIKRKIFVPTVMKDLSGSTRVSRDRYLHILFRKDQSVGTISLDTHRSVHAKAGSARIYYDFVRRLWFDEFKGKIVNSKNPGEWYGVPSGIITRVTFSAGTPIFETFKPADPKTEYCIPEEPTAIRSTWIGKLHSQPTMIPNQHLIGASGDRKALILANESNSRLTELRITIE